MTTLYEKIMHPIEEAARLITAIRGSLNEEERTRFDHELIHNEDTCETLKAWYLTVWARKHPKYEEDLAAFKEHMRIEAEESNAI